MPGLPGNHLRIHRSPPRNGGIGRAPSLSLFRLPPGQRVERQLQRDAEAVQRVEGGLRVTERTSVRNNMY